MPGVSLRSLLGDVLTCFQIQVPHHGSTLEPLRAKHDYLGAVISYYNFGAYARRKRPTAGKSASQRLRRIMCGRKHHYRGDGLQLYNACVRTTVAYGIPEAGSVDLRCRSFKSNAPCSFGRSTGLSLISGGCRIGTSMQDLGCTRCGSD